MDPLSAFSLAAGVVQFTDFAGRLLSDTVQVYKSATGQSSTTVKFSKIASDLRYYVDHIQDKADNLRSTTKNDTNVRISEICNECREVCTQLEKALEKLRATGQTRLEIAQSSLKVVLKGLWTKDEVDALFVGQQNEMLGRLSLVDTTTKTGFRQGLIDVTNSNDMAIPNASTQHTIAWTKLWLPRPGYQADVSPGKDDLNLYESIRDSLIFAALSHREKAIPLAYKETFRWVFKDPRVDRQGRVMWSDFPAWLQGDSNFIYWVTGKPGSGKSTHLEVWAGNRKLLLGGFYFWNAGTLEQKSHLGLLKTLLLECLSEMPELVPCVTPRRWTFRKIFNNPHESIDPPWSIAELQEAFHALATEAGESCVVALFMDGLDEFSGGHKELLDFISTIHEHGRGWVKICVSSRPWPVFEDSFKNNPKLRLEDLTKQDIEYYIRSNFESHVGFQELKATYEAEAEHLIHSISEKPMADGSSISELQVIIDELPEKISDLYTKIFLSIPSEHIQDCSRFLQMREHWSIIMYQPPGDFILSAHDLWLAEHEDAFSVDMDKLTYQQKVHIATLMRRKVASRTKGLLEVSSEGKVDYLHRTTHDWAVDNFRDITAEGPEGFDAYITGLEIELLSPLINSYELIRRRLFRDSMWTTEPPDDDEDEDGTIIIDTTGSIASSPNADVILAAQFCIVDYVRERVALDPSILNSKHNRPSILESAILTFPCSIGIPGRTYVLHTAGINRPMVTLDRKIELVTFLLDNGANFVFGSKTQSQLGYIQGIPVINLGSVRVFTSHPSDRDTYCGAIETLLGNTKYSSQRHYVLRRGKVKKRLEYSVYEKVKQLLKIHD
ncbi:uncharacterized protein F4812DRAFT_463213 [Daldinia caldariorum]|uniref:uncharacterized protein n=1 Tax=Daldinia caldariorum TaxID=326644 RepID=UPI00200758BE|nr:uncharacterized protein F4812DRAFT_463213 [Daldinia caldariorum]KAI1463885.1 hypothetical protein F4812DRAFT_463213 [Daldinia caldariorum]